MKDELRIITALRNNERVSEWTGRTPSSLATAAAGKQWVVVQHHGKEFIFLAPVSVIDGLRLPRVCRAG